MSKVAITVGMTASDVEVLTYNHDSGAFPVVMFGPIRWAPNGHGDEAASELLAVARKFVDAALACAATQRPDAQAIDATLRIVDSASGAKVVGATDDAT